MVHFKQNSQVTHVKRPKNFREWLQQSAARATSETDHSSTDLTLPVLIIGAGPAGLSVMQDIAGRRYLLHRGGKMRERGWPLEPGQSRKSRLR